MTLNIEFVIWVTRDWFGNEIFFYQEDFDHILDGHPEMVGRQSEIKAIVEQPISIYEAGTPKTAAFLGPSTSSNLEGLRAIVRYSSELYSSGSVSGVIATAYPVDTKRYNKPRIGPRLYSRL